MTASDILNIVVTVAVVQGICDLLAYWRVYSSEAYDRALEKRSRALFRQSKAQKEADALIRQVVEAYPAAINMTSVDTGKVLFSTPEMEALFGPAETSKSYYADPAERDRYLKELRAHRWLKDRRTQFINAKGETFWAADSSRLIDFNGEEVIVSNTRDLTEELALQEELSNQRELL